MANDTLAFAPETPDSDSCTYDCLIRPELGVGIMEQLSYVNFDIRLEQSGDAYQAFVWSSDVEVSTSAPFVLPFNPFELENCLLRIGMPRRSGHRSLGPDFRPTEEFGARLYKALFADEIGACFQTSREAAQHQSKGLRIRLRLSTAPGLAEIPWEFLFDPGTRRFLAQSDYTPIIRYLDMPQPSRPLAMQPPIRVLVMVATPRDERYAPLEADRELQQLKEALGALVGDQVSVERLERGTLSALQRQLRRGDYHVFHFIGHGGFDRSAGDGVLILEDDQGHAREVPARAVAAVLQNERTLRLVVLNSCEGARANGTDPFAGTAQTLVVQGIPAVIAMQFEISDRASIAFAREFYGALADGCAVDHAMAQTRLALSTAEYGAEWGTPVLYLRTPDGHIFDLPAMPSTPPGAAQPSAPAPREQGGSVQTLAVQKVLLEFRGSNNVIFCVFGDLMDIGRSLQCDLAFPRSSHRVSNLHARVFYLTAERRFMIEDLHSRNGTYVNNDRIDRPTLLQSGTQVNLARELALTVEVVATDMPALALIYCSADSEELARYVLVPGTEVGVGTGSDDLVRLPRTYDGRSAGVIRRVGAELQYIERFGRAEKPRQVRLSDGLELVLLNHVTRIKVLK